MATFSDFLNSFDPASKGLQFEHFVKWFLKNDPEWSTQIDHVWLWDEYPDRWGRDCGIDLVFKHKNNEIWAVQAKCYSPEYSITKADVDKFLSESNRNGIDKRLLIASTDQVGQNAKQVCNAQEKTVTHFLFSDFDKAAIDYPNDIAEINTAKRKPRPTPRPHQTEAIDAVEGGFEDNDRGQLIMACGTGKTFTTLWVKERQSAQSTLVLLPSLSLLSQTLREWTFASNTPFDVLCVCSDQTVGKQSSADEIIHSVKEVSFPVTSDVDQIRTFLKGVGNKVIFSTYQSSPIIAEAQVDTNVPDFDLVIADEAHRCTGTTGNAFTTVLDQSLIRANKRLFTTATPKTYSTNLKKKSSEMGVEITGMDDETVFGKVLYALTFGEAIQRGLLTDYQVILVGVDNPMIADWIQRRQIIQTDDENTVDAKSLASQIGLIKAIKDYDLKRMITFHSRVKRAETFASELKNSIDLIEEEHRPEGIIWTDYVSGAMPTYKRRLKLEQLKTLTKGDRGLLSNAKCLAEGVDVPSLDGVAFIDPRASQVDIVQAVGRAIRLSDDKTIGTIVLPVFIEDGDDAELSIQSSKFKPVWEVLNALKAHDDVLAFKLDKYRTDIGRGLPSNTSSRLSKIIFDLPTTIDKSFSDSLTTLLVEKTTSSWNFWFGLLEMYVDQHGHAKVPAKYVTPNGFKLGQWLHNQKHVKHLLTLEKISKFESLNNWIWDIAEFQWEQAFSYLQAYVQQYGHARVPLRYKIANGFGLGAWVRKQRSRQKQLTKEYILRLESIQGWVWDANKFKWEQAFLYLSQYVQEHGHTKLPVDYTIDGIKLDQWVHSQKQKHDQLSDRRRSRLESLAGWSWSKSILTLQWNKAFSYLEQFTQQQGHSRVPMRYETADDFKLGQWLGSQRKKRVELTAERMAKLESLNGWCWDISESEWENGFFYLAKYAQQESHTLVPPKYDMEGFNLGDWVRAQRKNKDQLTPERKFKLNSLEGWVWKVNEFLWEQGFNHLVDYVQQHGHARPAKGYLTEDKFNLDRWVRSQRGKRHKNLNREGLSYNQKVRLEALKGWSWNLKKI